MGEGEGREVIRITGRKRPKKDEEPFFGQSTDNEDRELICGSTARSGHTQPETDPDLFFFFLNLRPEGKR